MIRAFWHRSLCLLHEELVLSPVVSEELWLQGLPLTLQWDLCLPPSVGWVGNDRRHRISQKVPRGVCLQGVKHRSSVSISRSYTDHLSGGVLLSGNVAALSASCRARFIAVGHFSVAETRLSTGLLWTPPQSRHVMCSLPSVAADAETVTLRA